jgi:zinc finger SWIM domain-containing protein 3
MADFSAESILEYEESVRKLFASEDEAFEFYNKYAFDKGFSVRKSYVEWDDAKTEIVLRKFVCSRQGFREEKYMAKETKKRRPRDISRVGCEAKLVIARDQETGWWFVNDFIDGHNHALASRDLVCFLRSHRRISDEQKADIVEMEISGIHKHNIMEILELQYGGYDNVGCTSRDLYNFCYRYKQETIAAGDAETVIRQ